MIQKAITIGFIWAVGQEGNPFNLQLVRSQGSSIVVGLEAGWN
jgi:hypothetical protein